MYKRMMRAAGDPPMDPSRYGGDGQAQRAMTDAELEQAIEAGQSSIKERHKEFKNAIGLTEQSGAEVHEAEVALANAKSAHTSQVKSVDAAREGLVQAMTVQRVHLGDAIQRLQR